MSKLNEYAGLRRKGYAAMDAWSIVNTEEAFERAGGVRCECASFDATCMSCEDAPMRIVALQDDCIDFDTLYGDCYPTEAEKAEFADHVDAWGVYGLVGQYRDGDEWVEKDSCWGFIGDDLTRNGYDTDIMASLVHVSRDTPASWLAL